MHISLYNNLRVSLQKQAQILRGSLAVRYLFTDRKGIFSLPIILLCFSFSFVEAQLVIINPDYDFKSMDQNTQRYHDFIVENHGSKRAFILRAGQNESTVVKFSTKTIDPGEKAFVRVQINPKVRGEFSKKIPVYVSSSSKPINLKVRGVANFVDNSGNTACPDFSNSSLSKRMNEQVTILVKSKETGEPLADAEVDISTNPWSKQTYRTNNKGIIKQEMVKGMHFFDARYMNRIPQSKKELISANNNYIVLELPIDHEISVSLNDYKSVLDDETREPTKRDTVNSRSQPEVTLQPVAALYNPLTLTVYDKVTGTVIPNATVIFNLDDNSESKTSDDQGSIIFDGKDKNNILLSCIQDGYKPVKRYGLPLRRNQKNYKLYLKPEKVIARVESETKPEPETISQPEPEVISEPIEPEIIPTPIPEDKPEIVDGKLSTSVFRANNIVFLIDVSSSMSQRQRLDLLKLATFQLLDLLRDVDRMAIVTYASETKVVLESVSASETDKIEEVVMELQAKGFTAGGKGIKKAYEVARNNFIEGGNNEVVIMTDGAFNIGEQGSSLLPIIKKNTRKGIKMSVVGIKNGPSTYESLQNIAKKGNGSYVKVASPEDAQRVLVDQIKSHSKIIN